MSAYRSWLDKHTHPAVLYADERRIQAKDGDRRCACAQIPGVQAGSNTRSPETQPNSDAGLYTTMIAPYSVGRRSTAMATT